MTAHSLDYPFAQAPPEGQLTELAPGVRWLRMPLPFSLDHINLWLLGEGDDCVIVDTGLGDLATQTTWEALLSAHQAQPQKIVITHYHPDHVGCADHLAERYQIPVWMSMAEHVTGHAYLQGLPGFDVEAMVTHFCRHGLDADRAAHFLRRGNVYAKGVPSLPRNIRRLIDGDELLLAGQHWRVIMGYGHSPEHASLYCAEKKVLISGDMLLPRITTNVHAPAHMAEEDSVQRFLDSIHRFAELPADTLVLPSHGLPFRGIQTRLAQLDTHHAERDAELLTLLSTPQTAVALLPHLFKRPLDMHQLMFALGETIAHLNHLVARGAAYAECHNNVLKFMQHPNP